MVLRALFRYSDPNRFQNIFTTIFTLFTLLTLDDWSQIYVDSRANGGQAPGGWWAGGWLDGWSPHLPSGSWVFAGKKVTVNHPPPPPGAWYIIPILMIYIIIQYFIFLK